MLTVEALSVGPFQSNVYVAACRRTREAILVDAGDEAARVLDAVRRLGVTVRAIVCTHAHIDHVAALADLVAALSVPVWMHRAEQPMYEALPDQARGFGLPVPATVAVDRTMDDGERFGVGEVEFEVVWTPGHSPGGMCLHAAGENPPHLFAGDVLFAGSIGRTDLPGSDPAAMTRTLRRLVALSDETVVWPGHGPATTLGEEKRHNPFVAPLA